MTRSLLNTPTLGVALSDAMTVDELKQLAALTGAVLPTRKAELVSVITGYLGGSGLRRVWDSLDELQRAAVAEVVHAQDARFPSQRFVAKYGARPDWGSMGKYVRGARPTPLRFFFVALGGDLVMPLDLKERLRDFVPAPVVASVKSSAVLPASGGANETTPLTVQSSELAAGRELLSVLRLIDSGKVAVSDRTRRPSSRVIVAISSVLEGGDFYAYEELEPGEDDERAGPMRAFAWPMIVQAGGLAQLAGSKLELTKAGRKALGEPANATLVHLWRKWLGTTVLDELARVECVKGQNGKGKRGLTAVASRRSAVAATLARCPPLRWIHTGDLLKYVWATGHDFAVARNAWELYIDSPQYGSLGYDGTGRILEERYLLCLLSNMRRPWGSSMWPSSRRLAPATTTDTCGGPTTSPFSAATTGSCWSVSPASAHAPWGSRRATSRHCPRCGPCCGCCPTRRSSPPEESCTTPTAWLSTRSLFGSPISSGVSTELDCLQLSSRDGRSRTSGNS